MAQLIEKAGAGGATVVNVSYGIPWRALARANPTVKKYQPLVYPDSAQALVNGILKGMMPALRKSFRSGHMPLIVLSAGNDSVPASFGFPGLRASYPNNVLTVGASTKSFHRASFSSFGAGVDVYAPGDTVTTYVRGPQGIVLGWASGTSFAAPIVSGIAGLLKGFDTSLTPTDLRRLILEGAAEDSIRIDGVPVANAYASLKHAAWRTGAPLCGNRIWVSDDDKLTVARDSTGQQTEVLATLPANGQNGTYNAYVNAKHGGHRVEVNGYAVEYNPVSRSWSHVTTSDNADLDNGMFSAINGGSHDEDVWAGADISYDVATNARVVTVHIYPPDGSTRTLATLRIPLVRAPYVCTTQIISSGACTDSAPSGSFTDAAYMDPFPMFTGAGDAVLLPIDRLDGTATVGPWVTDTSNSDVRKRTSGAEVQVSRTDVYRISLTGTVPSDLVDHPVWSLSGRDIYWLAGSEDDKLFGVGSFVYHDPQTVPADCKNEYRSNSGDPTRQFGTLLSQPGTGAGPTGGNCWGDEKAAVAPNKLASGVHLIPAPARLPASASTSGRDARAHSSDRSRIGNPVQGYRFPNGLWEIAPNGKVQLTDLGRQQREGRPSANVR